MAYTTVVTHATGDVLPASDWNTYVRDNLAYLHGDGGATIDVSSGGQTFKASAVSTGPANAAFSGSQANGVFVDNAGKVSAFNSATATILQTGVNADTFPEFSLTNRGALTWGPGSGAQDTTLARVAAGQLGLGVQSTQAGLLNIYRSGGSGALLVWNYAAGTVAAAFTVNGDGNLQWGPGSGAQDTSLSRGAGGVLDVNNTVVETYVTTTAALPATFTPTYSSGVFQRFAASSTGTLTIASPGTPPANNSTLLALYIHNSAASAITLSWNAIYAGTTPTALPTSVGAGLTANVLFVYDPGEAKWNLLAYNT